MRPLGLLGVLLVIGGIVVLAMGGLTYTKDRKEVSVGPIELAAEEKGVVPPAGGPGRSRPHRLDPRGMR